MRYALTLLLVAAACTPSKVDPGLVGTWELNVPNADGVARWVWEINPDGTYAFHAEGPGNVPAHSGTFAARNGTYTLHATTMVWVDQGTYQLIHGDTMHATGRLGSASWTRVQAAPVAPAPPPSPPAVPAAPPADTSDSDADPAKRQPGVYTAQAIYDYLSHHRFDDRALDAPLKLTHYVTIDLDEQARRDGVTGITQAEVDGSISPATITFVVYRDRAAAEAARDFNAIFDSKTFRVKPGVFVSSHAYMYHERGEARCLSRLEVGSSTTATVTCYLLVQYPTREPVMIESEVTEHVGAKVQEASSAAVEAADDLLFGGLKEWAIVYRPIGGGD